MSSDIYIPLKVVLTNQEHFELSAVLNGDIDQAHEAMHVEEPDLYWVQQLLKPVLTCRFYPRKTVRYVDIFEEADGLVLHVSCGGDFLHWFITWLDEHHFPYELI